MKFLRTPEHKRLLKMLTTARQSKELTQQQLAEQIGERQSFIADYEGGARRLDWLENPKPRGTAKK